MRQVIPGRMEYSGFEALARVLHTRPSARRTMSLFVNMRAPILNEIVYGLMPQQGKITDYTRWYRGWSRRRFTPRPTPKDTTNANS